MSDWNCIVRIGTEAFKRGDTYLYGRTLRVLKSKTDFDAIHEESQNIGVQEALENIVNLQSVEDGLYSLVMCNLSHDWESGYIDDWNLKLIKYEEIK